MIVVVARFLLEPSDWEKLPYEPQFDREFFFPAAGFEIDWRLASITRDETNQMIVVRMLAPGWDSISHLNELLDGFPGRAAAVVVLDLDVFQLPDVPPEERRAAASRLWSRFVFPPPDEPCPICGVPDEPHMDWCPLKK